MANEKWLSQVEMPDGTILDIKDPVARDMATGGTRYIGKLYVSGSTYTHLSDGDTRTSVEIVDTTQTGHHSVSASGTGANKLRIGDIVLDTTDGNSLEYIYDGSMWELMGADNLGAFAFVDEGRVTVLDDVTYGNPTPTLADADATVTINQNDSGNLAITGTFTQPSFSKSVTLTGTNTNTTSSKTMNVNFADTTSSDTNGYTVTGTVSTPTISVDTAGSTTTIKNPTSKTVVTSVTSSAPSATSATGEVVYMAYDSSNERLSFKKLIATTGASISTSNVTVKNGDPTYVSSQPIFTATPFKGTVTDTFTDATGTVSVSGTVSGTTTGGAYTPKKYQVGVSYKKTTAVTQGTKSTTNATKTVTPYTPS